MAANKKNYYSKLSSSKNDSSDDEDSSNESSRINDSDNKSDSEDTELCLICAENIEIVSLSPCNHKICHLCSFRNIALYKKSQCLVCRSEVPHYIFTDDHSIEKFESVPKKSLLQSFKGDFGIKYTSEKAKDKTIKLLEYTCPNKSCSYHDHPFSNFKELNHHVNEAHGKYYCELCVKFKKAFISELRLYNKKQLFKHQTKGDSEGFKGHPECQFCNNKRFYSDDEKFVHMREKHEKCHICQELDPNNPQYFRDYNHLAQHFSSAHYVCHVQCCLDQKFVVFKDEFELQTHMAKEHAALYGNNILLNQKNFNSQLFTVPSEKKNKGNKSDNSLDLKKKRLEERAKHYLNNSVPLFDQFLKTNKDYKDELISADKLISKYHEIFKDSKDVDYELLLYELSGLFPAKSKLRQNIDDITNPKLRLRELKEQSPALPGTDPNVTLLKGSWSDLQSSNSNSRIKKSNVKNGSYDESYPSLPPVWVESSRASSKTRGISMNTPTNGYSIPGYNPISNDKQKSKTRGISTNTPTNGYKVPGYNPVENSKSKNTVWGSSNPITTTSIPTVKIQKSSKVNLWTTTKQPATNSLLFDEDVCPSLPKVAVKKKVIPRVNPINNSKGSWNGSLSSSSSTAPHDPFDMSDLGISLKIEKKKPRK